MGSKNRSPALLKSELGQDGPIGLTHIEGSTLKLYES